MCDVSEVCATSADVKRDSFILKETQMYEKRPIYMQRYQLEEPCVFYVKGDRRYVKGDRRSSATCVTFLRYV